MDISYQTTLPAHATEKFWETRCFIYSLVTLVAIGAIALIVAGAISYSDAGLQGIRSEAIVSMILGGVALAAGLLAFCLQRLGICDLAKHYPILSHDKYMAYKDKLNPGEFFLFRESTNGMKMSLSRHSSGFTEPYPLYYNVKHSYLHSLGQEVSISELQSR